MPLTDVYVAIQRGAMEGLCTGVGAMHGISVWEVAKYLTDLAMSNAGFVVIVNEAAYNGLPESYSRVLQEEMYALQMRMYYLTKINEDKEVQFLIEKGMTYVKPSPELEAEVAKLVTPYMQKWAQDGGPDTQAALALAKEMGYSK